MEPLALAAWTLAVSLTLPPLSLADGLPPHAVCQENHDFAGIWSGHLRAASFDLEREKQFAHSWHIWGLHLSMEQRRLTWQHVCTATDRQAGEFSRRLSLLRLGDRIGWRAVLTAEIEPPQWAIPAD